MEILPLIKKNRARPESVFTKLHFKHGQIKLKYYITLG